MSTFIDADGVTHQRHGHVTPQPLVARCGGPGMCTVCRAERDHEAANGEDRTHFYRVGRSWGRTIVLQRGLGATNPGPDGDVLLGYARTEEAAEMAVAALNDGTPVPGCEWVAYGRLIYPENPDGPIADTTDWIIALDDEEMAQRIVAALRGETS